MGGGGGVSCGRAIKEPKQPCRPTEDPLRTVDERSLNVPCCACSECCSCLAAHNRKKNKSTVLRKRSVFSRVVGCDHLLALREVVTECPLRPFTSLLACVHRHDTTRSHFRPSWLLRLGAANSRRIADFLGRHMRFWHPLADSLS